MITASIGIALYPMDATDTNTLLKYADMAMYQAKLAGKNQFALYDKKLNEKIINRNLLEQDIYHALENQELYLEYQPKISINKKSIVGFEALIRWKHPEKGILLPKDFVPIAENSELIVSIDKYVLDKACQQISKWKKSKAKVFENMLTSVNISSKFFHSKDALEFIKNIIAKYNISPHDLEIEITETTLVHSRKHVVDIINKLHNLLEGRVTISIDDFGTGYSSLNYLSEFPVDTIKIDQSFMQKIDIDESKKSIVEGIISFSHSLNLTVIAEGVETREQYEFLKKVNCDQIQGFLFAKSMSPENLVTFIENWSLKPR